ncbi:zinc metalloprotease HtpX [Candidatus Parabeggiatoa sp. HSG14]|uniref:zinc metalloprotease HtpX n=1 Tax=Candidatus Parabeggiatoa sp. HSG14 TaxID=3055593 RepID=UPI0025A82736|nr:zinc metalloprotease HtpX [Thiotrichales bacterium HSG14]
MDESQWLKHKLLNIIQSLLLVIAMTVILGLLGWLIGGGIMAFYAIALVVAIYLFNPIVSPHLILRMYRTQKITYSHAPNLHSILRTLAKRANLPKVPQLVYLPSDMMNAFAVGRPKNAVIALSDGLLRRLSLREISGVLAHEMSHIYHDDMRIMGFADITSRLTRFLSLIGYFLLLLNLPLLLFDLYIISWSAIFLLILAPIITDLLQLALSRTREYYADLGAAQLLGDPEALALALIKMERYQGHILEQIFWPRRYSPEPSLLRTHPPVKERVRRLLNLREPYRTKDMVWEGLPLLADWPLSAFISYAPLQPRWHFSGIWF